MQNVKTNCNIYFISGFRQPSSIALPPANPRRHKARAVQECAGLLQSFYELLHQNKQLVNIIVIKKNTISVALWVLDRKVSAYKYVVH